MKKVLVLPLFAMAVLVSQVWAAPCLVNGTIKVYCAWTPPTGNCWQIDDTDDKGVLLGCATQAESCATGGRMYSGAGYTNGNCAGMTEFTCPAGGCSWDVAGGLVWCDFGGPSQYGEGGCFQKTAEDCAAEQGRPVNSQAECNSGTNCYWEPNAGNDFTCACGYENDAAACTAKSGVVVSSCATYCTSPITTVKPNVQGLTVIPNGRSLHILSARDASVSLYDLAGNRVFSSKVSSGNSTVSLTQKQGVYYAVVTSGAQTQTVKVLLK